MTLSYQVDLGRTKEPNVQNLCYNLQTEGLMLRVLRRGPAEGVNFAVLVTSWVIVLGLEDERRVILFLHTSESILSFLPFCTLTSLISLPFPLPGDCVFPPGPCRETLAAGPWAHLPVASPSRVSRVRGLHPCSALRSGGRRGPCSPGHTVPSRLSTPPRARPACWTSAPRSPVQLDPSVRAARLSPRGRPPSGLRPARPAQGHWGLGGPGGGGPPTRLRLAWAH